MNSVSVMILYQTKVMFWKDFSDAILSLFGVSIFVEERGFCPHSNANLSDLHRISLLAWMEKIFFNERFAMIKILINVPSLCSLSMRDDSCNKVDFLDSSFPKVDRVDLI